MPKRWISDRMFTCYTISILPNLIINIGLFRKLQDKQEAQDIVQEVFVSLWEKREHFVLKTYLSGFLYKSILNKILNIGQLVDKFNARECTPQEERINLKQSGNNK